MEASSRGNGIYRADLALAWKGPEFFSSDCFRPGNNFQNCKFANKQTVNLYSNRAIADFFWEDQKWEKQMDGEMNVSKRDKPTNAQHCTTQHERNTNRKLFSKVGCQLNVF